MFEFEFHIQERNMILPLAFDSLIMMKIIHSCNFEFVVRAKLLTRLISVLSGNIIEQILMIHHPKDIKASNLTKYKCVKPGVDAE